MKKLLTILTILIVGMISISCTTSSSTTTSSNITTIAKEITVNKNEVDLPLNSEYIIDYDLNFDISGSETISFDSSDDSVISVSALGKVKALSYGEATVYLRYEDILEVEVVFNVSKYYEIISPIKDVYRLDELLNPEGGKINIYNELGELIDSKNILYSMVIEEGINQPGPNIVEILDEGIIYSFEIFRLSETQENILFDDFIYLNDSMYVGERVDFALLKADTLELINSLNNIYDYNEINVYGIIKTPDEKSKVISAFWYQDFQERLTEINVNQNLRLEGKVNDTSWDYDVFVNFSEEGNPHFRLRYLPEVSGVYDITLVVEYEGFIIQTFDKSFEVYEQRDNLYRGFVRVDDSNNRHFIFDNDESYIPVGQNVAWYTSVERKHYDYKAWFEQMGEVGMNYARVWMAAWGYSPFWNDIYNFDERQTNLYSLDKTIEYAEEADIYIQLCLLHHGMFSSLVNPMWPDSSNTWYVNRYGSNPYGDVITDSGDFFTEKEMIDNYKNQLKYIVARYGYSDHIMSFELFNEVDWIETYSFSDGLNWHLDMANYLKELDPNKHLISTSFKDQNFLGNNYKVFKLSNIDFVNVHHYGIYNHTDYLPEQQYFIQNEFNKPVIYDEIGYSGNGGEDQYTRDPSNVTLHQGLWAGAMGGGAGTGMHWWWESWVETYDVYDEYLGVSRYLEKIDLTGNDQQALYSEQDGKNLIGINSISIGYMGYSYQDRLYLYVFDKGYKLGNQNTVSRSNIEIVVMGLETGVYALESYNTFTGELINTKEVSIDGSTSISLPEFSKDIALILHKIG